MAAAKKKNEAEGTRVPATAKEQEEAHSRQLSQVEQARNEHNRRVAPGGAELPKPVTGKNPPRP